MYMKIELKIDGNSFFTEDVLAAKKMLDAFGGIDNRLPALIQRRYSKRSHDGWNDNEIQLVRDNMDLPAKKIKKILKRSVCSINTMKWRIKNNFPDQKGHKGAIKSGWPKTWTDEEMVMLRMFNTRQELFRSMEYNKLLHTHTHAAIVTKWYSLKK